MKVKDIEIGGVYKLYSFKNSTIGCSQKQFNDCLNKKVTVIKSLRNYKANNDVLVQHFDMDSEIITSFWCSAFDLRELDDE